ncbi:MAG: hypothetical protein JSU65_11385 [Candidatus Zixiibacteriota bacterium]|nr:MAG: hypothetical protein JSU65_11385 [candidate division Zixibacteria bacterium]
MFEKLQQTNGSALLMTLLLMFMLTVVVIVSADRASLDADLSYNQVHTETAFYAADAGITHAVAALNDSADWRAGFVNVDIGNAQYSVAVVDSSAQAGLLDTVLLRSTAVAFHAVGSVEARLVPEYEKPFQYAAFGDDSVTMDNQTCTDSYNSDSGSYASTQLDDDGDIGSNGEIILENTSTVNGDASTSSTGEIYVDAVSTVTGDTTSTAPVQDLTIIPQSEYDWAETISSAPSGFSGGYLYDPATYELSLATNDVLTLSSGVYYFSSITLDNNTSIQVAPGAEVIIYMTGNLTVGQTSSLNPGGSPSDLLIYSQGTELNIGQSTEIRAAFWGPTTAISIQQNTDVYGSFVGQSILMQNSTCVHYDRSLREITSDKISEMIVVAWREI